MWSLGTRSVCPRNSGRGSRNASRLPVSRTLTAGVSPRMMAQNAQFATVEAMSPQSTGAGSSGAGPDLAGHGADHRRVGGHSPQNAQQAPLNYGILVDTCTKGKISELLFEQALVVP